MLKIHSSTQVLSSRLIEDGQLKRGIFGWFCQCKNGARTLGCCAHVASVLWFMGFARYQNGIRYPSFKVLQEIEDCAHRDMPQVFNPNAIPHPH